MSKKSDLLEQEIEELASNYDSLPSNLPDWLLELGVHPSSDILKSQRIGSKDKNNKTDVLIELNNSINIKISVKLNNADYFGNWYGHIRFLKEFGLPAFNRLTKDVTKWANWWLTTKNSPFVGVSICFGKRSGNTAKRFLDIFSIEDIFSVVKGFDDDNKDSTANCLYINSTPPKTLEELIENLQPITQESIRQAVGEFQIAYRPINPMTEGTNRGKNVYTRFMPFKKMDIPTTVTTIEELSKLGKFETVEPNRLNHNHILDDLQKNYNIIIPRKPRKS
ncbi:hypothetical protein KM792_06195 [Clostridium tyrobutyricum]|uniref:hypothetical protein n=1 Tax=Clostridium tyrobutyricum TaxID=1519 RepID=UPI001C390369|nr:hypothetical protein [Clostridium tyrobutyricum]MBV4449261.1 hypothetical protein [Clostridium tyrobutyricum]